MIRTLFQTTEFYEKATDIIAIVFACLFLAFMLTYLILLGYCELKTIKLKKEFKQNLQNEHDKALIMEYENCKYTLTKRKNKK